MCYKAKLQQYAPAAPCTDGKTAAACFTPWNRPGICQTDPQAVLLNPSYPAQAPLSWAGFSLASLEDLRESLWSSDNQQMVVKTDNHHHVF